LSELRERLEIRRSDPRDRFLGDGERILEPPVLEMIEGAQQAGGGRIRC
jgi:hypothetical protein